MELILKNAISWVLLKRCFCLDYFHNEFVKVLSIIIIIINRLVNLCDSILVWLQSSLRQECWNEILVRQANTFLWREWLHPTSLHRYIFI